MQSDEVYKIKPFVTPIEEASGHLQLNWNSVLRMTQQIHTKKGSDFETFDFNSFCVSACGWQLLKEPPFSTTPDSAGPPQLGELAPHNLLCSGLTMRDGASWGRGQTGLTLGSQALAFTPGRYCTGENVSTKDHMAPLH